MDGKAEFLKLGGACIPKAIPTLTTWHTVSCNLQTVTKYEVWISSGLSFR